MGEEKHFAGKLKELLGHSAIYGLGSVLQALLGFVLLPIYTKHLSTEEYGVWALLTTTATIAGVVFYLGASSALARSFYDYPEGEGRRRVVNTSLLLTLIGAALQIFAGLIFAGPLSRKLFGTDAYATHIRIVLSGSAFGFINQLFYVVLRFQRRSAAVVTLNLLSLAGSGGLIIYLLVIERMGVMAPIVGEAVNQALVCITLAVLTREWLSWSFSPDEVRVQLLYGLPNVGTGLLYYLYTMGDRFIIQRFASLDDVGVYALGSRLGMLIQIVLVLPFAQIWTPVRMEMRDKPGTNRFFGRILTYYLLIGSVFALVITVFACELVGLLARRPEYASAATIVPLVVFAQLIYGIIGIVDAGIIYSRKVYYTTVMSALALGVNWGSNMLLIPRLGIIGAGLSLVASMIVFATGVFVISNRLFAIRTETWRIGRIAIIIIAALAIGWQIPAAPAAIVIGGKLLLLAATVTAIYLLVLDSNERGTLRQVTGRLAVMRPQSGR